MVCSGRAVRAGSIWATAVMTLIAGFPEVSCACPGGSGKPIPAAAAFAACNCTCGGSCCSRSQDKAAKKCCRPSGQRGAGTPSSTRKISGQPVCKLSLVSCDTFVQSTAGTTACSDNAPAGYVGTAPTLPGAVIPTPLKFAPWRLPHHAPPPDYVMLFQHFLI